MSKFLQTFIRTGGQVREKLFVNGTTQPFEEQGFIIDKENMWPIVSHASKSLLGSHAGGLSVGWFVEDERR